MKILKKKNNETKIPDNGVKVSITGSECRQIMETIRTKKRKYDNLYDNMVIVWGCSLVGALINVWLCIPYIVASIAYFVLLKKKLSMRKKSINMLQVIPEALFHGYTYEETLKKLGL